jgi:uncharacterized protein with FMN-binding domain
VKRILTKMLVIVVAVAFVLFWAVVLYGMTLNRMAAHVALPPLDLSNVVDGVYDGSATILHVTSNLRVTVSAARITSIVPADSVDNGDVSALTARVIKAQSLDVDGITGATITTKTVLKAIDNALAARP